MVLGKIDKNYVENCANTTESAICIESTFISNEN